MVIQNQQIAAYWDFENVHASLYDADNGSGSYRANRGRQPRLLELAAIVRYLDSLGHVTINRAFGNWDTFSAYRRPLLQHSIDLVQIFSAGGHAKNGADIRLAVEVMDDIHAHSHLSHVAILGGDSDFIPLAQKIRKAGKTVIGIGVRGSTNEYWEKACDSFTFYKTLLASTDHHRLRSDGAKNGNGRVSGSGKLLKQAIIKARGTARDKWVPQIEILDTLTKLSPEFHSVKPACETLGRLLLECSEMIEFKTERPSSPVRLRPDGSAPASDIHAVAGDSQLLNTTILQHRQ